MEAIDQLTAPIVLLDLHNTLYNEILEFGSSLGAGMEAFLQAAGKNPDPAGSDYQELLAKLPAAHKVYNDDWDNQIWSDLAKSDYGFNEQQAQVIRAIATQGRAEKSQQMSIAYDGVKETLAYLEARGARIIVVTDGTAKDAVEKLNWLGVKDFVEAAYSWPSREKPDYAAPLSLPTPCDPWNPGVALQKPHPWFIGQPIFDLIKDWLPKDARDPRLYFKFEIHEEDAILEIADQNSAVAIAAKTRLVIKDGPYQALIQQAFDNTVMVGDSLFKDIWMAKQAGVQPVFAAYGKVITDPAAHQKGNEMLDASTC